jgi:polysaccharide export outer membrane protein
MRVTKPARARCAHAFAAAIVGFASTVLLAACTGVPSEREAMSRRASDPAQIERAASPYFAVSAPGAKGYLIGPQDVLDITVFKAPDLSKNLQVAEDGTINFPLIGQMTAAGKSTAALEREIASRLNARYIKSPQVSVFVKEYNSQRVTVSGAVKSPGVFPLRGNETLMQVIAKSGGLDREVSSNDIVIFRTVDGSSALARYDFDTIRSGAAADPQVLAGDIVVVGDSAAKQGLSFLLKLTPLATPAYYFF